MNPDVPPSSRRRRVTIFELMVLIGGATFGLWLVRNDLAEFDVANGDDWLVTVLGMIGGVALVGPPLILATRRRDRRRRWGPGELHWFSQGMASWLLWPPIVVARARGGKFGDTTGAVCYFYGTPLMALFMMSALLAGGWLRPCRRRRPKRKPYTWRESFGLLLGTIYACTAGYVLFLIYRNDIFK